MIELIEDIKSYLNHPRLVHLPRKVEKPGVLLFQLTLICLFAGITGGMLTGILIGLKVIPAPGPSLLEGKSYAPYMLLAGPILWAPVAEELLFRAQLRRFTGMLLFVSYIAGAILSAVLKSSWGFLLSPVIFFLLFIAYRLTLPQSVSRKFQFWEKIFPWHFHFTALCFGLIHLQNFEQGITLLPAGLLYTLPQLAVGLIFGYTRMNYGLKYAIALHAMYNFLPALLLFSKY
ncbi:CPBP family glutamic-type intramembrane protease [Pedobacter sp. AW31-3R]|uniref:CPBP family glutamic-type intramembrane protease n=1 Tax=Pedobacter sp. AW31-3R TaxID=3445781 RepID=UPI003F9EBB1F